MRGDRLSRVAFALALTAVAPALSACSMGGDDPDLVAGKQQFVQKCGSCHVLGRAGTKGVTGPNLDEAFRQALADGMGRDAVQGIVSEQIEYPGRFEPGERGPNEVIMPADLVTGDAVTDVAAYVAEVTARKGEDTGLLATAVKEAGGGEPIAAKAGKLVIPADPTGQLVYTSSVATAPVGALTIESPNESTVPHNIVIDEIGKGPVVEKGGVSTIEGSLKAGKFTFYCSVPGHREAGMEGELTVE